MRSGSHVQLAALRNKDLELQTTSPFSNHGSLERSTACFRHKNVLQFCVFQKFPFFCVTLYVWTSWYAIRVATGWEGNNGWSDAAFRQPQRSMIFDQRYWPDKIKTLYKPGGGGEIM